MAPSPVELASSIINLVPTTLDRLRKYEEQIDMLGLRCDNLEREIGFTRQRIDEEREKQRTIREQIAGTGAEKGLSQTGMKRQRDEEQDIRVVKQRMGSIDSGNSSSSWGAIDIEPSTMLAVTALAVKREAKFFSYEETAETDEVVFYAI